jgi:hypothetical protein
MSVPSGGTAINCSDRVVVALRNSALGKKSVAADRQAQDPAKWPPMAEIGWKANFSLRGACPAGAFCQSSRSR